MCTSETRPQYAFLEVKRLDTAPRVVLSGPSDVLGNISIRNSDRNGITCNRVTVEGGCEITLAGSPGYDNWMLLKTILLEEILPHGFKPLTDITDDFMVLSREVRV
jgi:hypothetical protein